MIQLLIADDHAIMRSGLKQIFARVPDFVVVGEAVNGNEVLEWLHQEAFDLLLLDLNMPGISSMDLIARIHTHQPQLPILVLTMHNEPMMAARALKAGASGYITKDCEPEILEAAIRKVAAHGNYITPEISEKMVFAVASAASLLPHHQLTNRELEVLQQLVAGLSVRAIATKLSISNKTVSTHKTRLMEKLNISSIADLVRYAMDNDLLSQLPPQISDAE